MKYSKIILLASLLILGVISIVGCSNMKIKVSDENKNITELLTNMYSNDVLDLISNSDDDLNKLNKTYPIQCIRKNEYGYMAVYRSSDSILLIYFSDKGEKTLGKKYPAEKSITDFENIYIGKTLDDVMVFDVSGDYSFLYTGRVDFPRKSYHITSDGYVIQITYDDNNTVVNIEKQVI